MAETAEALVYKGNCQFDPCSGCPIQELPENMRARAFDAVEEVEERNVYARDRAGKYADRPFTNVVRRAVGGQEYTAASIAAMEAIGHRAMNKCLVGDDI